MPKLFTVFTGCNPRIFDQILGKQRLSDLYFATELQPDLELIVHTYNFRMTPKEVVNYMNEETIPARFEAYREGDLFWYALFTNCATYLVKKDKYKTTIECKIKTIPQLCAMFLEREIFMDLFERKEVCEMAVIQYSRDEQLRWEGREEGLEEGREEGIFNTISILEDLGVTKTLILSKLQEKYQLSESQARELLEKYSDRDTNF